jgi:hypothetical protein
MHLSAGSFRWVLLPSLILQTFIWDLLERCITSQNSEGHCECHNSLSYAFTYTAPKSSVGFSHMVVWQPRTRRWTRHTDNVAGSSDVSSKNSSTHQPDNSEDTKDSSNSSRDLASLVSATSCSLLSDPFVFSAKLHPQRKITINDVGDVFALSIPPPILVRRCQCDESVALCEVATPPCGRIQQQYKM